eukprot:9487922-Pyramimonas_sp.AAC.1
MDVIQECHAAGACFSQPAQVNWGELGRIWVDVPDLVRRLSGAVADKRNGVRELFRAYSGVTNGQIDVVRILRLLREVLPGATPTEIRYFIVALRLQCPEGCSLFTFKDIQLALRLLRPVKVSATTRNLLECRRGPRQEWSTGHEESTVLGSWEDRPDWPPAACSVTTLLEPVEFVVLNPVLSVHAACGGSFSLKGAVCVTEGGLGQGGVVRGEP